MNKKIIITKPRTLKERITAILKEEQWNGLLPESVNPSELAETIVRRL